jgi:predicted DCC family thiol-disulfide oxidoreductase YuxK
VTTLVIYDATCGVCSRLVRVVDRFGRADEIRLVPRTSEDGVATIATHWPDPTAAPESVIVVTDGRALVESDGVLEICRHLVQPFPLLRALKIVPRRARDAAYRLFAENRHRVSAVIGHLRRHRQS